MKPLLVTSGEPAGVGPDICLSLAATGLPVVVMGNKQLLQERARQLRLEIIFRDYDANQLSSFELGQLTVLSLPLEKSVTPGQLDVDNSPYVMQMLDDACRRVLAKEFSGLVTAPVHKAILNDAGFSFSGHTEFLKFACQVAEVVMLLASPLMKVALVTTHLPLKEVSQAITKTRLETVTNILYHALRRDFGVINPTIAVAGLNPHAGESGYLGREEIEVITPVIEAFQARGIDIIGPFPADTLFSMTASVFLTMYHDQGLPVIKYADFKHSVNVTLGLPIVRTSVDHGTALTLAGTTQADASSLIEAVKLAYAIARYREKYDAEN